MKITLPNLGVVGVVGTGLASAVYFGYQCYKVGKTAKKLDMTLDDLSKKTPVEIEQAVVDEATKAAVDREVHAAVTDTASKIRSQVRVDMDKEIRSDVRAHYDEMKLDVSKKIADEVAAMDRDGVRRHVEEDARKIIIDESKERVDELVEEARKKVNSKIDGVVGEFTNGIGNALSIYDKFSNFVDKRINPSSSGGKSVSFRLD